MKQRLLKLKMIPQARLQSMQQSFIGSTGGQGCVISCTPWVDGVRTCKTVCDRIPPSV